MKIWVKFVYGTVFQKILTTCLFFTKVQSTQKKRTLHAKFYNLSTVPNYNTDSGGPGTFNLIFANQFRRAPDNDI